MTERESLRSRCHTCVEDLNRAESWGLDGQQIDGLTNQILEHVPLRTLGIDLTLAVRHYYHDGPRLTALRNAQDPQHEAAWAWAAHEIARIIKIKGLDWSRDRSVALEDLVQVAQAELVEALASYRFESSLRTWLQAVTIRRLTRLNRDASAKKRTTNLETLDAAVEQPIEWEAIEPQVLAGVLVDEINHILARSGDTRYALIFHLRVIDDQSNEEIGAKLRLHPSRVRALFKIVREILQQHSSLSSWVAASSPPDPEEDTRNSDETGTT